jgi:hypothetical protein
MVAINPNADLIELCLLGKFEPIIKLGVGVFSIILFSCMFKNKKNIAVVGLVILLSTLLYLQGGEEPAVAATERLLTSYATSTTRSTSVNTFCAGKSRTTLTDSSASSAYSLYNSQMKSMFTLDGYAFHHLETHSLTTYSRASRVTP